MHRVVNKFINLKLCNMSILRNNFLGASLVLIVLLLGAFVVVKAVGNKEVVVVSDKVVEAEKVLVTRWFAITDFDSNNPDNKPNQVVGEELDSPPSSAINPLECSTANTQGVPCAVEFQLDPNISGEDLEGMTVSQVENDHSTTADTYAKKTP